MKDLDKFHSDLIDKIRNQGNELRLPGGEIVLPQEFGFCRGVTRALAMTEEACMIYGQQGIQLVLLGEIIHNPWVNKYFKQRGVRILSKEEITRIEEFVAPSDCAIIPAFGVSVEIERKLREIGCRIVDTSCGDVRRLWIWTERAVKKGFGVLIYGRALHDETVVTKSRLAAAGGKYAVVSNLKQAQQFVDLVTGARPAEEFETLFCGQSTNAHSIEPFQHLAQVSQTTMLYNDTMQLREILQAGFARKFPKEELEQRLILEPTVCRATQDRQTAALELCSSGCDLVVVIGGFGSSNTRHLYEVARQNGPAVFIEDADAIESPNRLHSIDITTDTPIAVDNWLPEKRPLRIGVLAGASSPEVVVGQVLEKLASYLGEKEGNGS